MRAFQASLAGLALWVVAVTAAAQAEPPPQGQPQPLPPPGWLPSPPQQGQQGPGPRQPYPYPPPSPYPPPPQGYPPLQLPAYPYPYPYPPPGYYPAPPSTPPPPDPSRFVHDGFFFQMAPGGAAPMVKLSGYGAPLSGRSIGAALSLTIGGTVSPGVVVAGSMDLQSTSVRLSRDDSAVEKEAGVRSTLTGITVGYYPDPKKGFFVQGGGGFATMTVDGLVVENAPTPSGGRQYLQVSDLDGLGVFGALGHEWFVQEQWSIGVVARFDALWTGSKTTPSVDGRLLSPSLRMTLTFH